MPVKKRKSTLLLNAATARKMCLSASPILGSVEDVDHALRELASLGFANASLEVASKLENKIVREYTKLGYKVFVSSWTNGKVIVDLEW